jgi:hypothetical protein
MSAAAVFVAIAAAHDKLMMFGMVFYYSLCLVMYQACSLLLLWTFCCILLQAHHA